ncbi:MAG: type II toxin-antitoxin system HicA family toxin [Candidatus Thermoplasmatota archaeon]|nr:type II toxin-antitoxin system HicA family toxin [Candidatus Thermoplasmatota archaeon]
MLHILKKKGFIVVRQSGSHMIMRNDEGIRITLPCHSGKILHPKIVKRIMEDAELSEEDL